MYWSILKGKWKQLIKVKGKLKEIIPIAGWKRFIKGKIKYGRNDSFLKGKIRGIEGIVKSKRKNERES